MDVEVSRRGGNYLFGFTTLHSPYFFCWCHRDLPTAAEMVRIWELFFQRSKAKKGDPIFKKTDLDDKEFEQHLAVWQSIGDQELKNS